MLNKIGKKLEYIGGHLIGVAKGEVEIGDIFELTGIERSPYNAFYWLEGDKTYLTLIESELENFKFID